MKVTIKDSAQHGRGVFSVLPIARGEKIMTFTGPLLRPEDVDPDDYHLQVDESLYLGPSGQADDYVNHSCAPNSAFLSGLDLIALRDIAQGEEITWDYGTAIDEEDFAGFPCSCGSSECRGAVRSFRHLDAATQLRLKPWLLPYLRKKYFSE